MRTFKLTLIGLALAIGITAARAATIPVVTGLNAITIPTVPSANYSAYNIFATAQDGETIYVWNVSGGFYEVYNFDLGFWDPVGPVFTPGQGIFYDAVGPQTFVANLRLGAPAEANAGPKADLYQSLAENRYYFQGSPTGESAQYEDIFGSAPNEETALLRFIPGSANIEPKGPPYYRIYLYKSGVWTPETPVLNPLEPVFVVYPYLSLKYVVSENPRRIDFTWPARASLQEADFPNGPWRDVTTPSNGYSVSPTNAAQYYRVKE